MPLIQVVNEADEPTGAATKQQLWEKGLWHRIIRIMVEDDQGRILLPKRAPTKQPYPGRWDQSVSGHVDEGESYEQAAYREMKEELGIAADLEELGSFKTETEFEGRKLNRFNMVYRARISSGTEYKLDPEEASEARWFTLEELKHMLVQRPDDFTVGFSTVLDMFTQNENY